MTVALANTMYRTLISLSLLISGCVFDDTDVETVTIDSVRYPCQGVAAQWCMRMVGLDGQSHFEYFGIEGFSHHWGVTSVVRYRREPIADPPQDGPSVRKILEEIIKQSPGLSQFDLGFSGEPPNGNLPWFVATSTGLQMHDTFVTCAPTLCDEILARAPAGSQFTVSFELTTDPAVLNATAVR